MLSAPRKKAGRPTYLSKYEESLIVTSYYIEGGHGLILDSHAISDQLNHVVKSFKFRHGDNDINKISSLKYCLKLIKIVSKRGSDN